MSRGRMRELERAIVELERQADELERKGGGTSIWEASRLRAVAAYARELDGGALDERTDRALRASVFRCAVRLGPEKVDELVRLAGGRPSFD